jgi:hypothetical protein
MKFRKKPVVIEAIQWTGSNYEEVSEFMQTQRGTVDIDDPLNPALLVHTTEGVMKASPGDWIIRGVKGEYYPCKPDIFEMTYEPVM